MLLFKKLPYSLLPLLILLFGMRNALLAKDEVFEIKGTQEYYILNQHLLILLDDEGHMSIEAIQKKDDLFKPFDLSVSLEKSKTYWGKLILKNDSDISNRWVLSPDWNKGVKRNSHVEVYFFPETRIKKTGRLLPYSEKKGIAQRSSNNQVLIELDEQKEITVYIKIWQVDGKRPVFDVHLMEYAYWRGENQENRNIAQGFFQGIVWIMLLYSLVNFWSLKDDAYLYYALFLFSTSIYFLYLSGILLETLFREFPIYSFYVWIFSTNLVAIGYFQFARSFIKTKKNIPFWDRIGKGFIRGLIIFSILETIYFSLTYNQDFINGVNNLVILLQSVFLLVVSVSYVNNSYRLAHIFSLGTLCLVMAGFTGVTLEFFGLTQTYLPLVGLFFILEIITFSWGLSHRYLFSKEQRLLKKAEAEKLKELDQMKSQFFANISHEFRTPLTVLLGSLTTLKGEWAVLEKQRIDENLDAAHRNSTSLLNMVNQVLDLSKLESKSMQIHYQHGDVLEFFKYLLESFKTYADTQGINLSYESKLDSLFMDYDPESIQRIFANLLSNALKFTEEGGYVKVFLRKDINQEDKYLEVVVKDSGSGIKAEDLAHIFERYYQVNSNTISTIAGSGIGLALVKEQILLLKGEISVNSVINEGTSFQVRLPILEKYTNTNSQTKPLAPTLITPLIPIEQDESRKTHKKAIPDFEQAYLLIIEDNSDIIKYISSILSEKYRLGIARTGAEGIDLAIEMVPDLIISDVMMPEKDGYEVCRSLKGDLRTSHIPIVLLTARASQEDKIFGLQQGADAYMAKPFSKEELLTRIEQLIEQRKRLQIKFSGEAHSSSESGREKEHAFITEARRLVEGNLDNEEFDIEQLCGRMDMTYTQFYRKLKALTNLTASIFIRDIRLETAHNLLKTADLNISEIAYEVGFKDPAYFSRAFSQKYGLPPTALRP